MYQPGKNRFADFPDADPDVSGSGNKFADFPAADSYTSGLGLTPSVIGAGLVTQAPRLLSRYLSREEPSRNRFADFPDAESGVTPADYGRAVMAGGGHLVSGAGYLAGLVPGLESTGKSMQRAGQAATDFWTKGDPHAEFLGAGMSPAARAEQGKEWVRESKDGSGLFGYEWGDAGWHTAGLSAAQSLLGTAAGMGVGGGLTKGLQAAGVGAKTAGVLGYGAGEATVAAGSAGDQTYRTIMGMSIPKLMQHPEFRALLEQPGMTKEAAREHVADLAAKQAAATTAGSTFVLSAPMGALVGKILSGVPLATTKPRAAGMAALGEAAQEAPQSAAEQIAQNKAIQDYADESQRITEGVINAAIGGAAAGGIMGGGLGGSAVTEVQGERDAIASIKSVAENFAFDRLSDEQLDNAIRTGHELAKKYKDKDLKSAVDALVAEKILRSEDKIVPPEGKAGAKGKKDETKVGAEPWEDVATDPNKLQPEPPGFFDSGAAVTTEVPEDQKKAQVIQMPGAAGYQFTGLPTEGRAPDAQQQTGLRQPSDLRPEDAGGYEVEEIQPEEIVAQPVESKPKVRAVAPVERKPTPKERYQKSAQVDERQDSLGTIVAKLGGISATEAEQNGFDKQSFRGYGWKIKRAFNNGQYADTFDGMRERLSGYGFDFPDINSLIDALQEDIVGNKRYTPTGYEAQMERQAAQREAEEQERAAASEDEFAPPVDAYTGDMYEPVDAETREQEYNANWSEDARTLYELLEEASVLDEQGAQEIWESGRDGSDVAVALYDFIRDNEKRAQRDRREGQAQPGTGAQAEAPSAAATPTETATAGLTRPDKTEQLPGSESKPKPANADLLGDDTGQAQAIADEARKKDEKRSPAGTRPAEAQSGDDLFAGGGRLPPDLFAEQPESKPAKAQKEYEERNASRLKKIESAKTESAVEAVLQDEYADNERTFDKTSLLEKKAKDKKKLIKEVTETAKKEAAGEWVVDSESPWSSDREEIQAYIESKQGGKYEYRITRSYDDFGTGNAPYYAERKLSKPKSQPFKKPAKSAKKSRPLSLLMLDEQVRVGETGKVETIKTPADELLSMADERIAALEQLKRCLSA